MSRAWTTSFRLNGRSANLSARSPFAQGLALLLIVVGLVVIVPLAIVALIGVILLLAARRVRRVFVRMREPNGALDGRQNVRVRMPEDEIA